MNKAYTLDKSNIQDIISLSPMQHGMLFHYLNEPNSRQYIEQLSLKISTKLNAQSIIQAWTHVVENNEMLRCIYKWDKIKEPLQIILKKHQTPIEIQDLSKCSKKQIEDMLSQIKNKEYNYPIDIRKAPLRIKIICLDNEGHYEFIITYHHIIYDGWSNGIIIKELLEACNTIEKGEKLVKLEKNKFKEYIKWCKNQDKEKQKKYWKKYFHEYNTRTSLSLKNNNQASKENNSIAHKLSKELSNSIYRFCKDKNITLATILYTAWGILLQKYNNTNDVVFGTTVSGRNAKIAEIENIVGLFINTLPLRINSNNDNINNLLSKVDIMLKERDEYQHTPLVDIMKYSIDSKEQLFDTLVVIENYPLDKALNNVEGSMKIEGFSVKELTNYKLSLRITDYNGLELNICYNRGFFDEDNINRLINHYKMILENIINNTEKNISQIDILSKEEKHQLLIDFNKTQAYYPKDKSIHQLFEQQVKITPENIAVRYQNQHLTYKELNEKSNQLAKIIKQKLTNHNSLTSININKQSNSNNSTNVVGIMLERSINMIISILAILKAGASYLPIDSEYPSERIDFMLEDSSTKLILTQKHLTNKINRNITKITLDSDIIYTGESTNIINNSMPYDIAYIIYTSGSTGKPKGVMIQHSSVCNLVYHQKKEFNINQKDRVLQFSSISFDASVEQIFISLLSGATLVLVNKETILNIESFQKYIEDEGITHLHAVPSFLNNITWNDNYKLKRVVAGGDICPKELSQKWIQHCNFYNEYGPTETTVTSIELQVKHMQDNVSIGKPIANTRIYIFDKQNNLCPIGVAGQLCIAGDGLARGYLNRPNLTVEKFIQNPIDNKEQIYLTGDLARWLSNGNIEFLGRIDNQVKIRGYRIELGEIETKLTNHNLIKEAVVITQEEKTGAKYLCAYLVCNKELTVTSIREHLSKDLPDYMIPSHFVMLDKLPLTSNGKINRKKLSKIEAMEINSVEYEAPRNKQEEKLVSIWKEVLDIDNIGINNNFFEIGGHSLKATSLVSKIHKELDVQIPLKVIFNTPTVKGICEYIDNIEKNKYKQIKEAKPLEINSNKQHDSYIYNTSSVQKRLYTLQQFDTNSTSYNMSSIIEIEGNLDKEKLVQAFKKLIQRHESLRTSFELIDEQLLQRVRVNREVPFKIEEYKISSGTDKNEEVNKIADNFIKAFDLSKAPLLRVGLIEYKQNIENFNTSNKQQHMLLLDVHHIIADGVSLQILLKEFVAIYEDKELTPLSVQYKDYSEWQKELQKSEILKVQEKYWIDNFKDEIPVLNLLTDYPRPSIQSFEGKSIDFKMNKDIVKNLKSVVKTEGSNGIALTSYMVLLSAFNILLSKYSGQEDIVIGSPIAGRSHSDFQSIIGMFVNTLAIRNYPEGQKTIRQFLNEVKENSLKAFENQDYQFEELVEKLEPQRDMSRNPLFDIVFTMENESIEEIKSENLLIKVHERDNSISKFDITFTAKETEKGIKTSIQYCTRLFNNKTIEKLYKHYENILKQILNNLDKKIKNIELVTESEKQQILIDFNSTKSDYPKNKTIQELFEEQAQKTPNSIAVTYRNQHLSYRQLNEKSNQLARILQNKICENSGLSLNNKENTCGLSNKVVGIMAEKSLEMIIGIMAILKTGATYLPIDVDNPQNRINYMLEDSKAEIMLTQSIHRDKVLNTKRVIELDDEKLYMGEASNLVLNNMTNGGESHAYIIYTSGSTGNPKGVAIKHYSLNNFVHSLFKMYTNKITKDDNCFSMTSISFDVSVGEIFLPLCFGATLVLNKDNKLKDIKSFVESLIKNQISFTYIPPTILEEVYEELEQYKDQLKLSKMLVGVEAIKDYVLHKYKSLNEQMEIVNAYGPTETTICSTMYKYQNNKPIGKNVTIGKPIDNTCIYILDKYNNPCPIGVAGEICIAGDGLIGGYINRPQLTAEKLIENPFKHNNPNYEKIYKTGDLAKWTYEGNIDFIGRIDNQAKIRGYRIEFGEIEKKLLDNEFIDAVVVIARVAQDGAKYLCAYLVAQKQLAENEIRTELSKDLPEYMIPSYFIQLDQIPLTANGKIAKKELPEPQEIIGEYEAPANHTEKKIATIWQEILKKDKISTTDSFFELGGHSLKATSMMAKLHKELDIEISLMDIFKNPTIKSIAKHVKNLKGSQYSQIEEAKPLKSEGEQIYSTSSAQKRIYTLQQFDLTSTGYNITGALEIEGELNKSKLEDTFKALIQRQEVLRTSFELWDEELVQKIHDFVDFEIEYINIKQNNIEEIIKSFIRPFNLKKAPLLRVGIVNCSTEVENSKILPKQKQMLLLDLHHIIADGVSINVLVKEFVELHETQEILPLRIQYKDYATWQNKLQQSDKIKQQEEYWLDVFKEEIPMLKLPTDYPRPKIQSFEGNTLEYKLDEYMSTKLKKIAQQMDNNEGVATLYMVMLATFNILLSKYSKQEDIIIGSPIAGRPYADLQNIMGMFVNTLAMRNYPEAHKTFGEFLQEVKKNSINAFDNQQYQFEELLDKLNIVRDLSRNPLFDVMFAMQNIEMEEIQLELLKIKPYKNNTTTSKFDITFTAIEQNKEILISIQYNTSLFTKETIQSLYRHYENIIREIIEQPNIKIGEIELLAEEEKQQILVDFNNTNADYPKHKALHQLFEQQTQKAPNNTAVVYKDKSLSYKELNKKANQLAKLLINKGIKQGDVIALLLEPSLETIVGIMAVLKSGAIYTPIDHEYPQHRIEYVLEDSGVKIILCQSWLEDKIPSNREIIPIDEKSIYTGESENIDLSIEAELAYIIYTSGSTGKPKGVKISHKSLVNYVTWLINEAKITMEDKSILLSSYAFDLGYTSLYSSLVQGAELHIISKEDYINPQKLIRYMMLNKISYIKLTPSLFNIICNHYGDISMDKLTNLRLVILGGEQINTIDVEKLYKMNSNVKIMNHYGPTEATIGTVAHIIERNNLKQYKSQVLIGKPINNTKLYIVDKSLNLVPKGVSGELCISGHGLAEGYLNREELTKEKFISSPFEKNSTLYKTGDLARWTSSGSIELLGRMDYQVKIRGYRIELGEIEKKLLQHKNIKEAKVIARDSSEGVKYLCAYLVTQNELSIKNLREHLSKDLPEYMIPLYFIEIPFMPLTLNGKIDTKQLKEVDENIPTGIEYQSPRNEIEEKLVEIWKQVLKVNKIGINDNFFELGGHSLKATSMIAKLHKELNIELALRQIFNTPTIKEISEHIKNLESDVYSQIKAIEKGECYQTPFKASSAQKRIYTLQQFDLNSTSYNMPGVFEIQGKLDIKRLENSFKALIDRHESLRTSFEFNSEMLVQKVHEQVDFKIYYVKSEQKEIQEIINNFVKAFDLTKAPLLRVKIVEVKKDKHYMMFDLHHIISDGVSMSIFVKEFTAIYGEQELPKLRIQYKDYAAWQNELLESDRMKRQEEYWLKSFIEANDNDQIPVLNLPTDYKRPLTKSFEGNRISHKISKQLTSNLKQIATASEGDKNTSTLYMILLATFNILLSKYSGQEDIIIGSPIAGRPHSDLENIIGMFVNTLAMRNYPKKEKTIKEFIQEVRETALLAYENQDYQFEELVDKLQNVKVLKRDLSRNPIFDVMFAMQNTEIGQVELEDLEIKPFSSNSYISKFDMSLTAVEKNEEIVLSIEYCTKIFRSETIERMLLHYENILKQLVNEQDKQISQIELITQKEKQQILIDFNDTKAEYPKNKTIQQLFEEQVQKTPDNLAVVFESEKLSYRELNYRANQIATAIIQASKRKEAQADKIIGIMLEPCVEMLVGILGILKAGAGYMPIDPKYPKDRIEYMIKDSEAEILLTQSSLMDSVDFDCEILLVDNKEIYNIEILDIESETKSNNLAYVIYTSGSTGKPKGVMVEHKSLVNLSKWHIEYYQINETDRSTKYAGFGFDASVVEIFPYIICGASIYIMNKEILLDVDSINEYYENNAITVSFLPTQMCEQFMKLNNKSLKTLLTGGDKLNNYTHNQYKVIDNYGPTENTVVTTTYEVDKQYENIPIGKPIKNATIYILDKHNNLQPIGVPGELCVLGDGLARGYLNRLELTKEKFVSNPFNTVERMYRTGDLARWLPNGNIEFLGRMDYQVKIRGFRIELGEIENKLIQHKMIKEAVVLARKNTEGEKYLCAYIVSDERLDKERKLTVNHIREYLSTNLPEYMIPAFFIQIPQMPLTANGKIDKKELEKSSEYLNSQESMSTGIEYQAPSNEIEEQLVDIWREILKIDKIGVNHSFFEIGGHSLKATNMIAQIHKKLEIKIPLNEVFKSPTIKAIAQYIKGEQKSIYSEIQAVEEAEYYRVSSAQKRIHTLQQFDLNTTSYNMPGVFEIHGELDKNRLEKSIKILIKRHEALRTSFEFIDENLVQVIHKEVDFELEVVDKKIQNDNDIEKIIKEFVRPFDLSKAPLVRAGLANCTEKMENEYIIPKQQHSLTPVENPKILPKQKHMLLLDLHHIISDGVSMSLLVKEFSAVYDGQELPKLRIQYKDYAVWQNQMYKEGITKKQEKYWLNNFRDKDSRLDIPVLNLPTDYQRPNIQSFEGNTIDFVIDKRLTEGLRKISRDTVSENGTSTLYMIMLATLNILLSKYSRQEDIIIGSPIAGRPHGDLENIIGMFVNTLAMRNYPKGNKTFKEFLQEVKQKALKAYENQDYQFEELVDKLGVKRDLSRNPLFDVMLVMQNIDLEEVKLKDLTVKPYKKNNNISKFDITVSAVEMEEEIVLSIQYCTKLFNEDTIKRFFKHFTNIIKQIQATPNKKISEIELATEEEKKQILLEFNNTTVDYPKHETIQGIFEEQVQKTPNKTAIVCKKESISYKDLNKKANELANTLVEKGIKPNAVIGLMVNRSMEMVIGMLGILKAGGIYLPIDSEYPIDRIEFMLGDCSVELVLLQSKFKSKISQEHKTLVIDYSHLESESLEEANKYSSDSLDNIPQCSTVTAYIMYTSGSTGKPKGVMVEHKNVVRLVKNTNYIQFKEDDKILQTGAIVFDACTFEIWGALLNGLELHLVDTDTILEVDKLGKVLNENKITILWLTSSLFNRLVQQNIEIFKRLRYLLAGGDVLTPQNVNRVRKKYPQLKFINGYGPTENTTFSTCFLVDKEYIDNIPIGKPISNSRAYIVDEQNKLLPIGVAGELCVAGDGLSKGYLNRPELTAEKFVPSIDGNEKMYKTGDLARWLSNGNIEFLGRMDTQVKIRGYRIELGEIENKLLDYMDIKEAVVISREDKAGSQYICAYMVSKNNNTTTELREYLSKYLPDYMIPSYFIHLDSMPLTTNGKVNKKELPEPSGDITTGAEYEAPRNNIEEKLVQIWKQVLNVNEIGIKDNFFDLGGHSLKATTVITKIHKELNVEISLKKMFVKPTIKELGEYISIVSKNTYNPIETARSSKDYPLSSAQNRLFILNQINQSNTNYNMTQIYEIIGKFDRERIVRAFEALVLRHEVLRTYFTYVDSKPVQKISQNIDLEISFVTVKEQEIDKKIRDYIRPFDITKPSLMRVIFLQIDSCKSIMIIDIHHIISDGISMNILTKEFVEIYEGKTLEPLKLQYKDYAVWHNKLLESDNIKKQETFWINKMKDFVYTELSGNSIADTNVKGSIKNKILDTELTKKIESYCKRKNITKFTLMLGIFKVLLLKYTGESDITIGTPNAGRNYEGLDKIVGLFLNILVIRTKIDKNLSFKEYLQQLNVEILDTLENQEYPYELLYSKLKEVMGINNKALFSIMFNYTPQQEEEYKLNGISLKKYKLEDYSPKYDIVLYINESTEMNITIVYKDSLYSEAQIEGVLDNYIKLLDMLIESEDSVIKDVELSNNEQEVQDTNEWDDFYDNDDFI